MSYQSLKANNYYLTVYKSGGTFSSNYGTISGGTTTNGVNSGGTIAAGVPYENTISPNSNLTFDSTGKYISIPVRGLYYVGCCYNLTNNDSSTSNNLIYIGFTVSNSAESTHTGYTLTANPEAYSYTLKNCWNNSQILELQAGDRVRGTISDVSTTMSFSVSSSNGSDGRGSTYLSVALIAPFSG